jgi:RHS repeat-associated protein
LDRVTEEKQPDIYTPANLVTKVAYTYHDITNPRSVHKRSYLNAATSTDSYTYLDGFDRVIQERQEAEDSNYFSIKDYSYNKVGLLESESLPYFSTGTSTTAATTTTALFYAHSYDPLQRITISVNAVGTTTSAYDQWTLTVTDALGNAKDLYKDAYDNLVQVDEHNGTSTYTTNYEYDLNGNLIQIEDALDNIRNFTFDGLGRLLTSQDLHASEDSNYGTTTNAYDDSGNLTQKIDPAGQIVNYTYDDINRVLTENYTGQTGTEIEYGYDWCAEGEGRLCTATSTDAVTNYTYNALGLVETEAKTINSNNYETGYDYDQQGNLTLIAYPDNSEVKYEYNTAGLLETVSEKEAGGTEYGYLVSDIDYNPLGQITYRQANNSTETYYTYDPSELYRLVNKTTTGPIIEEGEKMMSGGGGDYEKAAIVKGLSVPEQYLSENLAYETADGSVLLYNLKEQPGKRTADSKTWLTGWDKDGKATYIGRFYGGQINYFDKVTGQYEDIDTTLVDKLTYWEMNKAAYSARIERTLKENFATFENQGQELYFSLTAYPKDTVGAVKTAYDTEWANKEAVYADALGKGIDIEVGLDNESLEKYVVIDSLESLGDLSSMEYYEIPFLLTSNQKIDLKAEDKLLSKEATITTSDMVEITDDEGVTSYIWAPYAQDDSGSFEGSTRIQIEYKLTDDGILLTKKLPVEWLKEAKYPVRTDASVSYYAGNGDGNVGNTGAYTTWATVRNAGTGNAVNYSGQQGYMTYMYGWDSQATAYLYRGFMPIDTSGLGEDISIASATLHLYNNDKDPNPTGNSDYIDIVQTSQAATSSLCTADYDAVGSVSGGTISINDMTLNQYNSYALSTTGLAWISKTGYTMLGFRNHSDLSDTQPTYDQTYQAGCRQSEYTGTTSDPYLMVYYTIDGIPTAPTGLLTEGETNPTNVSDQTPEFSAIYNNPDSPNGAIYSRIQVATSSAYWDHPLWDSGKAPMATTSEGTRSPNISYGSSTPLEFDGATYYWRIKFWDTLDQEGAWSDSGDYFQMSVAAITGLQNLTYTYDKAGNIIKIEDNSETNADKAAEPITLGVEYVYDDLYRLISASTTNTLLAYGYLETYDYNAIGNITNKSDQGNFTYSGAGFLNPHAVSQIAAQSLTYDNNGNLTNDGTWVHGWTYNNRLASSTNGSVDLTYAYDHTGQRVKLDNGSSLFIYPNKYYNIDTSSGTTTKHIFTPTGELIATVILDGFSTTTHYLHTDHLGGSSVITDENGQPVQVLDYYPFGDIRLNEQEDAFDEQRKFTGHEYDDATELNYMLERYQSPDIGRFISKDTWEGNLLDPQSLNKYSYSRNNPIIYIDPSGNSYVKLAFGVGSKLLGFIGTALMVKDFFNYGAIEESPSAEQVMSESYIKSGENQGDKTAEVHPNNQPENQPPKEPSSSDHTNMSVTPSEEQDKTPGTTPSNSGFMGAVGSTGIKAGDSFGELGTVVESKAGKITGFIREGSKRPFHGLDQAITRGVTTDVLKETVANPSVVLKQAGGNILYLTKQAAVVLNEAGKVVTTYAANLFKSNIKNIIKLIK